MKRKIKKIFFEVIFNSKNFKKFFSTKLSTTKIFPNLQGGLDKGGGDWTTSNTVYGILKEWNKLFINVGNFLKQSKYYLTYDRYNGTIFEYGQTGI